MGFYPWFWSYCLVAGALYTVLIVSFYNGWNSINVFRRKSRTFATKVSVILPFYNEATLLVDCVEGLLHQNIQTAEYEIILVDDQSTDESTFIAKQYSQKYHRVRYLLNPEKGKKQAILNAVELSKGELIITTDADCSYNEFWLASFIAYYEEHKPNLIVGPVMLDAGNTIFQKFQQIEFLSLIVSGAGAIGINHAVMCNGANLAFKKSVFLEMEDPLNLDYESGDDVFLLHSMKKLDADKIHFLKTHEAVVLTTSQATVKSFFKQRFRWISKAPGYSDGDTKFTAVIVFAASVLWVLGLFMMVLDVDYWKPLLVLFLIKTTVDMFFLSQVAGFFGQNKIVKWLPFFEIFYGFYVSIVTLSLLFNRKKKANEAE